MNTEPPLALKILSIMLQTEHSTKTLNAHATATRFDQLLEDIKELCQQDLAKQNDETFEKIVKKVLEE